MSNTDQEARLLATIKKHAPARVIAYNGDDDAREINVPKNRKRWNAVCSTLAGIAWSKLELLDARGALMATIDNNAPASHLEDLTSGDRTASSLGPRDVAMARTLLAVMLEAQEKVLSHRDAETKELLQAQGSVVRELVSGMRELRTIYEAQVEAAATLAATRAEAEHTGGDAFRELLQAAPQLLQMLPMLRSLLPGSTAPAAPPNGAKKA